MKKKTKTAKTTRPAAKARPAPRLLPRRRAQTAIEYVMMISATVVFITLTAFFIKTRVIAP